MQKKMEMLEWIGFLCRGRGILSPLMVPELHLLPKKGKEAELPATKDLPHATITV